MGKTIVTVGLTVLVVLGLVAVVALFFALYQTNSKLEVARSEVVAVTGERDSAIAKADEAVAAKEEVAKDLAQTKVDLERTTSELDAMKPSFDFMTCAVLGPILPPASFTDRASLERYLSDYLTWVWPGAVITQVDDFEAWTNDPATYWDFYYDYAGGQGFIMSFLVYADSTLGYRNGIYSFNDECFIVPPAGDPASIGASFSVEG